MKKLVLLGCGKLNNIVADALIEGLLPGYEAVGLYSRTQEKAEKLAGKMQENGYVCRVCKDFQEVLDLSPDYIIEAASPAAVRETAVPALEKGISVVTLSIGALADDAFYEKIRQAALSGGARLYVVSGATGGFDVLQTATLMGDAEACFFNEKGPDGLKGTQLYSDSLMSGQKEVFSGSAAEAIRILPTKVNVTVAASRASVGPDKMKVTMLSTPGFKGDTQRVEIKNPQVHAVIDVYSETAAIAGWSVVNTLRNLESPVVFC